MLLIYKKSNLIFVTLFSFLINSCAAPSTASIAIDKASIEIEEEVQRELLLKQNLKYQNRLNNIAHNLFIKNKELCQPDVAKVVGIQMYSISDYSKNYKNAAKKVYNLDNGLTITSVIKNSPAETAGLKVGDKIISVTDPQGNKFNVGINEKTVKLFRKTLKNMKYIDNLTFEINRKGIFSTLTVEPEYACSYDILLSSSDALNASADGMNIYIDKGMMRFVDDDNELALVIAHELAHNAMNHIDKATSNRVMGSIVDIAAAAYGVNTQGLFAQQAGLAFSKEFENEADYVALYYLARAGIDFQEAGNFWRRMGAEKGVLTVKHATTHPTSPQRFLKIDKAIEEINLKMQNNEPLVPNYKR